MFGGAWFWSLELLLIQTIIEIMVLNSVGSRYGLSKQPSDSLNIDDTPFFLSPFSWEATKEDHETLERNGLVLLEGDMVISTVTHPGNEDGNGISFVETLGFVHPGVQLWRRGNDGFYTIPFQLHHTLTPQNNLAVRQAIRYISRETNIRFQQTPNNGQHVRFIPGSNSQVGMRGCWSYVGDVRRWFPIQDIGMDPGCANLGIASHEILHTLGLPHEQSRSNRLQHISFPPDVFGTNTIPAEPRLSSHYDIWSVMHYSGNFRPVNPRFNGFHGGNKMFLTSCDFYTINIVYVGSVTPSTCFPNEFRVQIARPTARCHRNNCQHFCYDQSTVALTSQECEMIRSGDDPELPPMLHLTLGQTTLRPTAPPTTLRPTPPPTQRTTPPIANQQRCCIPPGTTTRLCLP